jgi:hypothetical protein
MAPTPFDRRELAVLFAALLVAMLSGYFRRDLQRVPEWRFLLAGIVCLIVGSTATIVEHFALYDFFNTVEHVGYLAQSLMLALWAWRARRVRA